MSFLRRVFDGTYRRARRAEGRGDFREAAELYAEAGADAEAGEAWLLYAERLAALEERLAAYRAALRWFPEGSPKALGVYAHMGMARLDEARRRGLHTAEDRRALEEAAAHLERAQRPADAATAYELLGMRDAAARCLEVAGEIERLEALLEAAAREANVALERRSAVRDYEVAMVVGQRREAQAALERAIAGARKHSPGSASSDDGDVRDLMRRLEARRTAPLRCSLRVEGAEVALLGALPVTLGREADICVRGTGVSRRHCRIGIASGALVLEDLGSSNGTLLRGVALGAPLPVTEALDVGLGDEVSVRIEPHADGVCIRVLTGLDAGSIAVAGMGVLALPGASAQVQFEEGFAVLRGEPGVTVLLDGQRCVAPIDLLRDDVVLLDQVRVEVVA